MSLGTTDKAIRRVGVGNEITNAQYNGKDYIEIQLSLEPMGKGRTDPNVSSLVYDSGNLGYLTINSIKCSQLLKLWKLSVTNYGTGNYTGAGENENITVPTLENEDSYIKFSQTLVFRFRISIEKAGDIPATITIGTEELGESSFIVILQGHIQKPRPYYAGEISCPSDVSVGLIEIEKENNDQAYFYVDNLGDYNLDITSIEFQDSDGNIKDYAYITDGFGGKITSTTIYPKQTQVFYVSFDARGDRTGNKWTESFEPPPFTDDYSLRIADGNLQKRTSTNNDQYSFHIPLSKFSIDEYDNHFRPFINNPKFVIKSNDQSDPEFNVNILDSCLVAPFIKVKTIDASESINFLDVVEGTENYKELIIKNSGYHGDLIISDMSINHQHTDGEVLITTDYDFSGANTLTIPAGKEAKVTLQFLNSTYSDSTSLKEKLWEPILKYLTIKSNAINATNMPNGYSGTSGSYALNNGETVVDVNIKIIPQVKSHLTEKYIRPFLDFYAWDSMDIPETAKYATTVWFVKNSSLTTYSNDEIEAELTIEYRDKTDLAYQIIKPITYDSYPKLAGINNIPESPTFWYSFADQTSELNKPPIGYYTYTHTTMDGSTTSFNVQLASYSTLDFSDTSKWLLLVVSSPSMSNYEIKTDLTWTLNYRLKSNNQIIGSFTRDTTVRLTSSPRPNPIAEFHIDEVEGLKYASDQVPQKFNLLNTSRHLDWWNMNTNGGSEDPLVFNSPEVYSNSETEYIWRLAVNSSGVDVTSDYKGTDSWYENLSASDKVLFDNNKMRDISNLWYQTKGNKTIELTVKYKDDTLETPAFKTSSNTAKQKVSIYDSYNPKMEITPTPYATLSPNFFVNQGTGEAVAETYRTELLIYNNSNFTKLLTVEVINKGIANKIILDNEIDKPKFEYYLYPKSSTSLPITVLFSRLNFDKTFIKGYEEGKLLVKLDDDKHYAIINIVASHSVRKDHYITTNENYFNEIIFPISDKDLSSDEFNRDLETDLYVKARVNNQTHFSRHYVGLNFNTNSEI